MYLARIIIKGSAFGKLFGFATAKLLKRGYRDHKIRNTINSIADTRLTDKCNVNLKTSATQHIKKTVFYGKSVYMLWLLSGPPGFTCWISLAPVFS